MFLTAMLAAVTLQSTTLRLCVNDAISGLPVTGVSVVYRDASRVMAEPCQRVPRGQARLRRPGYRPQEIELSGDTVIFLLPVSATLLDSVLVRDTTQEAPLRSVYSIRADDARAQGASSVPELLAMLPFTELQQRQGSAWISLRGARREHTVVTVDGVVVNDPSTGVADVNELPLGMIGSVALIPGASGTAVGGVLAIQTNAAPYALVRAGSFGERAWELSLATPTDAGLMQLGVAWESLDNDFLFRNTAASTGERPPLERRINSDRSRLALSGSMTSGRWRVTSTLSREDRGMAGAMNVHTYDLDRSHMDRLTVSPQLELGDVVLRGSARYFVLAYEDPTRPVFDYNATVNALDAEMSWRRRSWSLSAGAGTDILAATAATSEQRARGFLMLGTSRFIGWGDEQASTPGHTRDGVQASTQDFVRDTAQGNTQDRTHREARAHARPRIDAGIRVDAYSGFPLTPSFNLGLSKVFAQGETGARRTTVRALISQALRAPTLYDLYFSSPQRIVVKPLRVERVAYDAELGATFSRVSGEAVALLDAAFVMRRVNNAIVWFPGNFGWSPANVGNQTMRGAEARAQWKRRILSIESWGAWYSSELHSGALDIPVPYVPRGSAGARLSGVIAANTLSVSSRFTGARPFTVGPRNSDYELPGMTQIDAAWSRTFRVSQLDAAITASVRNLTDVNWQSVRGFPEPGRSWTVEVHLTPVTSH